MGRGSGSTTQTLAYSGERCKAQLDNAGSELRYLGVQKNAQAVRLLQIIAHGVNSCNTRFMVCSNENTP